MLLVDKLEKKFMDEPSMLQWLDNHEIEVDRFLDDNFLEVADQLHNKMKMVEEPTLGYLLVNDSLMSNWRKQEQCLKFYQEMPSVSSMIGRKGGGKSCFTGWLSDAMHKLGLPVVWFEVNTRLPDYIQQVTTWDDVPQGALVIVDEAGVTFNARDALKQANKDMSKLLMVSRHHDLRIVFNYQAMSLTDINIWRLSDAWLVKPLQLMDTVAFEDSRTRMLQRYLTQMQPRDREHVLFSTGDEWIRFRHPKPAWWTEDISKGYAKPNAAETVKFIVKALESGTKSDEIINRLKSRGITLTKMEVQQCGNNPKVFAAAYKDLLG